MPWDAWSGGAPNSRNGGQLRRSINILVTEVDIETMRRVLTMEED